MTLAADVIRDGRRLKPMPIPVSCFSTTKIRHRHRYEAEWVLVPGTKIALAPHGAPMARQIILAAEVASQIGARVIVGKSRVPAIVEWRTAAYLVIRELMPKTSGAKAARHINRDHSTMVHATQKHLANPDRLAGKIAAIKAVLV